jgi:hypothetical protein
MQRGSNKVLAKQSEGMWQLKTYAAMFFVVFIGNNRLIFWVFNMLKPACAISLAVSY